MKALKKKLWPESIDIFTKLSYSILAQATGIFIYNLILLFPIESLIIVSIGTIIFLNIYSYKN